MPDCISDNLTDLIIRWGYIILEDKYIEGYELDSFANLYAIKMENLNYIYKKKIGSYEHTKYCGYLLQIRNEFIKIQTLHSPGDTSRFVEYINQINNTNLRALWNPKFQTVLSKGFREIYDSLSIDVGHIQ